MLAFSLIELTLGFNQKSPEREERAFGERDNLSAVPKTIKDRTMAVHRLNRRCFINFAPCCAASGTGRGKSRDVLS